jgi:ferredoxin
MKRITGILFLLTLVSLIIVNSCKTANSYYVINQDKCVYCQKCVTVCGYHAITMKTSETDRDTLIIDPNKCVGCGECFIVCTDTGFNAITAAEFARN